MTVLTQERVRELFDYSDGVLIRKIKVRKVLPGDIVGKKTSHGYYRVGIDKVLYQVHRVIWLWHYGYFPEHTIDHINRNKIDNRIENLREASKQCNMRNSNVKKCNRSGVTGVSWQTDNKRWDAGIRINKKSIHIGSSKDFLEAVAMRLAAEQCIDWCKCDSSSSAWRCMKQYQKEASGGQSY